MLLEWTRLRLDGAGLHGTGLRLDRARLWLRLSRSDFLTGAVVVVAGTGLGLSGLDLRLDGAVVWQTGANLRSG